MPTGFRGPLRYRNDGHHLDFAPLYAIDILSQLQGLQHYADDFIFYSGPNTAGASGGWILTETAVGAGATNRVDVDDNAPGGLLKMFTRNAVGDGEFLQQQGEPWKYVVGKRMWYSVRLSADIVAQSGILVGLAITDTSPIVSLPTDGIFFTKAAAATKMDFHARKAGVSTSKASIDPTVMVDATMREYSFSVDALGGIRVYVDRVEVATAAIAAGDANIPSTLALALHLANTTGEAVAHFLLVDHLLVAQER